MGPHPLLIAILVNPYLQIKRQTLYVGLKIIRIHILPSKQAVVRSEWGLLTKETSKLQITHNRCDIIMTSAISFRRWETQPAPSSMLARALAAFVATRMLLSSKPFLSMIATLNRNQHSQGRKRKPKLETLWISGFMQQLTTMPDGVSTPN